MGLFVWRLVTTIGYRITRFTWLRFVARLGDDTWLGVGEFPFPTTPSNNPQRAVRSSPTRKRITMVGTAAVGLTAPAVRPVARATQGASARAARSVRVGAVVPGVSSRSAPGLRHRPVRGRRVIVGERKSDSGGPLDTVELEECLQVRLPPTYTRGSSGFLSSPASATKRWRR